MAHSRYVRNHVGQELLTKARGRAKRRGLPFDLVLTDIEPLPTHCPVLGIPLAMAEGKHEDGSYTLERIDNRRGYVKGNVIVISYKANRLKSDASLAELRKLVDFYSKIAYSGGASLINPAAKKLERPDKEEWEV